MFVLLLCCKDSFYIGKVYCETGFISSSTVLDLATLGNVTQVEMIL
jgi:hypothetical protein